MNKKLALGLATTCAATLFMATQVSAASELTETTDGSIIFYKDNKPKPGPFEKNLALAYVPGEFNFGTNTLNGVTGTKVYNKVATGPQYLAVSDDRVVKDGWSLVANMGEFVSSKDSAKKLEKAELSMNLAAGQRYNIDVKASDEAGTPVPHITDANSLEAIPTSFLGKLKLEAPIKLVAGETGTKNIMKYSYAQGAPVDADGVTVGIASEVKDVRLTVQDHKNLDEAKYTTTVNWALSATATD